VSSATVQATVQRKHWTSKEYFKLAELGFLDEDSRVELIAGEIYSMAPQNSRHATAITLCDGALRASGADGLVFRIQLPLALADDSVPEPDLAIVSGAIRDYANKHPTTALLVVEVSDSTSSHDHRVKTALYARYNISEFWLLDLQAGVLEVYREPRRGIYRLHKILTAEDIVSPLFAPNIEILVDDLLP
jgi:Uma2 family endonuclease